LFLKKTYESINLHFDNIFELENMAYDKAMYTKIIVNRDKLLQKLENRALNLDKQTTKQMKFHN